MELAGRSPGLKGKGRQDSDGTPSMGSSFSDLDGKVSTNLTFTLINEELTRTRCISNAKRFGGGVGE